jgi:hypothetical protein
VPQTIAPLSTLPLCFIAESKLETIAFVILTHAAWLVTNALGPYNDYAVYFRTTGLVTVTLVYLPVLVMVLRRPNEGEVPTLVERAVAAVRWLVLRPRRAVGEAR